MVGSRQRRTGAFSVFGLVLAAAVGVRRVSGMVPRALGAKRDSSLRVEDRRPATTDTSASRPPRLGALDRLSYDDIRQLGHYLDRLNKQWSDWPGQVVRDPAKTEPHYLQHRRLLLTLAGAIERTLAGARDLLVVDLGAGKKPYYPLLATRSRGYVGVDLPGTAGTEVIGVCESLPLRTDSVDVVLSTQTLEHADDPARMLQECRRILRPNGVMFASTHGISYYHPFPVDHWRWTQSGLRLLFERAGFRVKSIEATNRTLTTLATILATHFLGAFNRIGRELLAAKLLIPFNLLVAYLDGVHRLPPQKEDELGWGSMPWTYVVVAEKVADDLP